MNFVDTGALVKLYLTEPGSEELVALALRGKLAVSVLTYAEDYATHARLLPSGDLTLDERAELSDAFEVHWPSDSDVNV